MSDDDDQEGDTIISALDRETLSRVREAIIGWYDKRGRRLPWRTTTDPYQVLIAEMLLRRTTARAVSRVYHTLLERFPDAQSLMRARPAEVRSLVASLGLQNLRARHLQETARLIVEQHGGRVPRTRSELESLPGLGRYGAAAVLNFAFQEGVPLVDGNVVHLLRRVFGVDLAGPDDERAWHFMAILGAPDHDPRLYWGIIDLVAEVCLRRRPRCHRCPLAEMCVSRLSLSATERKGQK